MLPQRTLFRNPDYRERLRDSQRKRFVELDVVDQIYTKDVEIQALEDQFQNLRFDINLISKQIVTRLKLKQTKTQNDSKTQNEYEVGYFTDLIKRFGRLTPESLGYLEIEQLKELSKLAKTTSETVKETILRLEKEIEVLFGQVANILDEKVPISKDERDNVVLRVWGQQQMENSSTLLGHYEVMKRLGLKMSEQVTSTFGNRSYFLQGDLFLLQQALIQYATRFLVERNYLPTCVPVMIRSEKMAGVAQLSQYDDELYKVMDGTQSKYLIATSEQAMVAYHRDRSFEPKELPKRFCAYSDCFRREAGNIGKDMTGIFRVHQFGKVEQFCLTSPDKSSQLLEEMIQNSELFYQSLEIPYRVVNIVSGELNNSCSVKYDLEGWFPVAQTYRELVSCSNCTDYQSMRVNCRYMGTDGCYHYVHMLNSTLCAITRTLCVICETHQTGEGVRVPKVLQPFIGKEFLPFR